MDLAAAHSIGGVEPHKYSSTVFFPWNTINPCIFCNVGSWVRGGGEHQTTQQAIASIAREGPGNPQEEGSLRCCGQCAEFRWTPEKLQAKEMKRKQREVE